MKYSPRICFLLFVLMFVAQSKANIHLSVLFQDGMVLQRDKPASIWGTADKGEKVTLSFNQHTYSTTAGKDGKWKITMPAQAAGGPFSLSLQGNNTLTLSNVLFGDVWICGGQSNMQFKVRELAKKETDSLRDNNSLIRIFTAGITTDYVPQDTLKSGTWKLATVETIQDFSAVAFFFGRYIQEHIKVPIGLISDNLGATAVEQWMSNNALAQYPQFEPYYQQYLAPGKSFQQLNSGFDKIKEKFSQQIAGSGDPGFAQQWYNNDTDTSDWKTMNLPAYWEDAGLPGYDGSVWFKRTFDLPASHTKGKPFHIGLGEIDDYDMVWVNGVKLGESFGNLNLRDYNAPDSILHEKNNVITVRVFDAGNKGGMYNFFWFPDWRGRWQYKPGLQIDASSFKKPAMVNANIFGSPSVLYNGNIAPLTQLAIKGAIWYQGEANTGRAEEYSELFPAMIKDWRKQFNQGDFPFFFVQLANLEQEPAQPGGSEWAELREAQTAALQLPNTGMASAIDIGEANDIHPKNKQDVGKRLALAAMKVAYGQDTTHTHPLYESFTAKGDSMIIHLTDNVMSRDKYGYVHGFSLAGKDSVFHWAKAFVRNGEVVVYSAAVTQPVAVRYAWANNPGELDLYNKEGLPLLPFRTDKWPGVTAGRRFKHVE